LFPESRQTAGDTLSYRAQNRALTHRAGWMAQISDGIRPGRLKQFAKADKRLRAGPLFHPHPVGEGQSVVESDRRPSFKPGG
jgi:hypothetical protein